MEWWTGVRVLCVVGIRIHNIEDAVLKREPETNVLFVIYSIDSYKFHFFDAINKQKKC